MYVIQEAKQQILQTLKTAVGQGFVPVLADLASPPDASMGDVAFPCFDLAKKLKRNPAEIASEIAAKIGPKKYLAGAEAHGNYVNFVFDASTFGKEVLDEALEMGETFGTCEVGKEKRVMVEFANLNSHKDVHVGHLRNLFVGQTAVNLLKACGYDVVPVSYINDLGLHVAQSVWAIQTKENWDKTPKDKRIDFLREVYVEANQALEKNPALKEQVTEVFKHLEDQKGSEVAVWKITRKWSLDYLKDVFEELGLTLDYWYFESQLIKKTKKIIDGLIKDGIVVLSQGAWIVDLQDEHLGVNLLIKSDGTLLYNAKDLALALEKEKDYHSARSIYVVDARQTHALQQLFATLKRMKFERELTHLSYEFVTMANGAMAARKGNVVRYETLRDEMVEKATKETAPRHREWTQAHTQEVSRTIAFAAMRFSMLKQDVAKKIVFDLEESLSFDGFTGPYLLYTYARIQSIFKKAGKVKATTRAKTLTDAHSHALFLAVAQYPEILFRSAQELQPAVLAQYLFDLAKLFSNFYEHVPVLQAREQELPERLALLHAVSHVLKNGLGLLGIDTVEEM
ncbi:arginine--tRNA ligase [Candidatus Uhrbacteria bacterium]|nr:arginine--tRNA ligase [Candidatus Uhrbacteria bacterium]